MKRIIFLNFIVLILTPLLYGEENFTMGSWRAHLPYHQVKQLVVDKETVYGASFSGIISYNWKDGTIDKFNRTNSLSDVGISTFDCHYTTKNLLIGYYSGNIDIMKNGKVYRVDEIYRADIIGDKTIKHFKVSGDSVYIVLPFAISVMNIHTRKITATYFFGNSNISITVNDVAIIKDSLYVATNTGIFTAPKTGTNLLDFNNWKKLKNIPFENDEYGFCESWGDTLWLGKKIDKKFYTIFKYKNGHCLPFLNSKQVELRALKKKDNFLYLITYPNIYAINNDGTFFYSESYYGKREWSGTNDFYFLNNNRYIVSDINEGFVFKEIISEIEDIFTPNGPQYNKSWHINITDDDVWVSGGSQLGWDRFGGYGIYSYKNNNWTNYNQHTTDLLKGIENICFSITNPRNKNNIFAGSWGYGVIEFLDGKIVNKYDPENSKLEYIDKLSTGYNWISGMVFDNNNNLWIIQSEVTNSLVVLKNNGEWDSFNIYGSEPQHSKRQTGDVIKTPWGDIWVVLTNRGLLVFNPEKMLKGEDNAFKILDVVNYEGNKVTNILSIAIDHNETIWLGLKSGGVLVYYDPRSALTSNIKSSQLLVQVEERVEYLLGTEEINCITVDKGNRKWFGTIGGGAYLLSESGNKEILNLTKKNSPLISDVVYSIGINDNTGEVYFATDLGVVSYFGTATKGEEVIDKLDIYPNPVHKDYYGNIIIRGLMEKTIIKITDLSGKIIWQTTSNGGTGLWNGCDFDGNRVPTGVYYVFCTSVDGLSITKGKILITGK